MPEDWEVHWEDYYEILQVHPLAEADVIEAAYKRLARKYHPDFNQDPKAQEQMKKINRAYEVLRDPKKRKRYDGEWFKKKGTSDDWAKSSGLPKPKPVVTPQYVSFKDVTPGEVQTASFVIENAGGSYTKIWISNPNSWVRIVSYYSLTDADELPLRVEIEATVKEWGKTYVEYIQIKLDEEKTRVKIELQTKSAPARKGKIGFSSRSSSAYRSAYSSPSFSPTSATPPKGLQTWENWLIGALIFFGLMVTVPVVLMFIFLFVAPYIVARMLTE